MNQAGRGRLRAVLTGGGTGGHIYPALALAERLQSQGAEILYIGGERGFERELATRWGIPFAGLEMRGLPRRPSVDAVKSVFVAARAVAGARRLIADFKPDVAVGTGGYVAGPVMLAALLARIPTVVHEQNAVPGLTNRILAPLVTAVAMGYREARPRLAKRARCTYTGNPVRKEILERSRDEGIAALRLDPSRRTLLIFGGSQASGAINQAVDEARETLQSIDGLQVVHVAGPRAYKALLATGSAEEREGAVVDGNMRIVPYLHNMADALAAADLAVCRAGALSLAEITVRGIPAIVIPFPGAAGQHQLWNARVLADHGAAALIEERELSGVRLGQAVSGLLANPDQMRRMADASRRLGRPDAADRLADLVHKAAGGAL